MTNLDATLAKIAGVQRSCELPDVLQQIALCYGVKTVAYLATGVFDRPAPRREPLFAVTYSTEWVERYRTQAYLAIDPAIQVGLRRLLPVDWDEFDRDASALRHFFGEANEFGLGRRGLSFPVHGHRGERALVSVTADLTLREWRWARRTVLRHFPIIATHLHEAMLRAEGVVSSEAHLSRREMECLRWTSEGKTVWECGVILGLSPHTVRCYLESARHKLGASSNTHAVSIALRSGRLFQLP